MGVLCKWKIDEIVILPFGGITIFKEKIDKPLWQEMLIALSGPCAQLLFFISFKHNQAFINYNLAILIFNLLPIFPLDGSKIMNVMFNYVLPFKLSHKISLFISYLVVFLVFISLKRYLFFIVVLLFIIFEVLKETAKHSYYFNKFLLERYLYPYNYKKAKIIVKKEHMKRQTRHIFKLGHDYFLEDEFIKKIFDK